MSMSTTWDKYGRWGIDLAATATSVGFTVAKTSTRLGFSFTRSVASTITASPAISTALSLAEQLALAPIFLGEYITATSLLAAHSSINILALIFPGSSEASFSLSSFVSLVRREWSSPARADHLPETRYSVTEVARALMAWGALQGVTQEWQEKRWLKYLREIKLEDRDKQHQQCTFGKTTFGSRVRVTSDVIFPRHIGQIISADIGEAPAAHHSSSTLAPVHGLHPRSHTMSFQPKPLPPLPPPDKYVRSTVRPKIGLARASHSEIKATLRRLSKMVLAGYGGASLLFFGVSPLSASSAPPSVSVGGGKRKEEAQLAHAIESSEAEAAGRDEEQGQTGGGQYSWWDILLGRHDHEILERFANTPLPVDQAALDAQMHEAAEMEKEERGRARVTATVGAEHQMPRFWVLTDHGRRQIVLVLRGTMSLNELAVDLTCEPEEFEPAVTVSATAEDVEDPVTVSTTTSPVLLTVPLPVPFPTSSEGGGAGMGGPGGGGGGIGPSGSYRRFPRTSFGSTWSMSAPRYTVHGGMLKMARAMGGVGCPVQRAVGEALGREGCEGYELVLCGHSLGAGVAALLGLMWADPKTCLTVRSSGLPSGRRTSVYCLAPPCLTDPALSALAANLVVSLVYSNDVVARLSLGSVRDIKNAALWMCEAQAGEGGEEEKRRGMGKRGGREGYVNITRRAGTWKAGRGQDGDMEWFIAVRKTLEANMAQRDLYPPGRVLWAVRDGDLHLSHRVHQEGREGRLRLFEVTDVEKVFGQIVFARDMLSAHLPHQYDRALHELL